MTKRSLSLLLVVASMACSDDTTVDADATPGADAVVSDVGADDTSSDALSSSNGPNPSYFLASSLSEAITTEACTLSGGTETMCYRISVGGAPEHEVGPFCPRNISEGPEAGGIWIDGGSVYDVSGQWITELATFYSDPVWQLYNADTGAVNVTETAEACAAAARPNVDPAYNNYCVECQLSFVDGGVSETYLVPVTPVPLARNAELGRMGSVGIALNGIPYDPPAPTDAILAAHTIAAFDDCGGHVNLIAGYHYHAATGCPEEIAQTDGHGPLIGYAMDGYGMYAMVDGDGTEPSDLDECRGHTDSVRGYHYHVASAGENMFIGCFHGEQGSAAP